MRIVLIVFSLLLSVGPAAAQDWGAVARAMSDLEAEGYFARCEGGSGRGCALFTRLVAHRLNPTGDPGGWGWLAKGGGLNYDGYAEDAMAWTAAPTNLRNVVDIVCGSGAAGARPCPPSGASSFVQRRTSDVWEAPKPLSAADLAYLRPGTTPTPTPTPNPPPAPAPGVDLSAVLERLAGLEAVLIGMGLRLEAIEGLSMQAAAEALNAAVRASEIKATLAGRPNTDWPEYVGSVGLPGVLGGQRTIVMRPRAGGQ